MLDVVGKDFSIVSGHKEQQPPSNLQQKILREQVRLIYKQGPTLSLGAAAAAACITFLASKSDLSILHTTWLLVVAISAFLRLHLFRIFTRDTRDSSNPGIDYRQWGRKFALGSLLAGFVWTAWPVLFYANFSTEYLLMISALFAGMVAVLATSGSVYLPAFYCFAVPLCFPLAYFHMASGVDVLVWTGWLLVMFFFVNFALALRANRHYAELIEARFRNSDLMRQLAAEKQLAETAVSEKNSFIASASHDLRQPLHALSLFVASLQRSSLSERQQDTVNDMQKSCSALNDHFSSILDVSRLESDSINVSKRDESITSLLQFLESDFRADADEKGIGLILDLPSRPVHAKTDRLLFERVLRNVVGNAIRFTRIGGVTIRVRYCQPDAESGEPMLIETDSAKPSSHVVISVTDTGSGVPLDEQTLIFNDYHRGVNGADTAGLGLGLAIVKRLCRLLDLTLKLESKPGEGSRFHIIVAASRVAPLADPVGNDYDTDFNYPVTPSSNFGGETDQPGGSIAEEPLDCDTAFTNPVANLVANPLANRTVLVIDDEPAILAASKSIISSFGACTLVAGSLPQAKDAMAALARPPDAIVCDYRLEGEYNGVEIVEQLRSHVRCEIPAFIITGDTSPERLRAVSASGLPVLYKPLTARHLKEQLLALLN